MNVKAELLACRVCLATDIKLFYLPTHPLADTFEVLTGISLSVADGLPQHICSFCSSLLRKYAGLREKCLTAYVILQAACSQNQMITTDLLRGIDTTHLKHNLFIVKTLNIDIVPTYQESSKNCYNRINSNTYKDLTLENYDNIDIELLSDPTIDYDSDNKQMIHKIPYKDETCTATNTNDITLKVGKDDFRYDDLFKTSEKQFKEVIIDLEYATSNIKIETSIVASKTNTEIDCGISKIKTEIDTVISKTKTTKDKKQNIFKKVRRIKKTKGKKIKEDKKEDYWSQEQVAYWSKAYNFDIVVLSKEEQRQRVEARKDKPIYLNSNFKCEFCFRGFSLESEFEKHMVLHDQRNGEHVCAACRYHFPTKARLSKHSLMHRISANCKECNRTFSTLSEVKKHSESHKGVKFECEHCDKCFTRWKSKVEHIRIHHGSTLCVICGEGFTGAHGLRMHMKLTHPEAVDAVCSTCSVQFHSAEALSKHACEPGALPCAQCGDSFSTEETLKQHQQEQHMEIQCEKCMKGFRNERFYTLHCARTHGLRPSNRRIPRSRIRQLPLKSSKRNVHQLPCMCDMCGTYQQSASALREHQRVHTGEKPYQCDYCSKSFRTKMLLQDHINIHTGARPHKCPNCPKAFKSGSAKIRHQLVHNKKRPHTCQLCGKTFQTTTAVKLHVRTVHMKETVPRRARPPRSSLNRTQH